MPKSVWLWLIFWKPEKRNGKGFVSVEPTKYIPAKCRKIGATFTLDYSDDLKGKAPTSRHQVKVLKRGVDAEALLALCVDAKTGEFISKSDKAFSEEMVAERKDRAAQKALEKQRIQETALEYGHRVNQKDTIFNSSVVCSENEREPGKTGEASPSKTPTPVQAATPVPQAKSAVKLNVSNVPAERRVATHDPGTSAAIVAAPDLSALVQKLDTEMSGHCSWECVGFLERINQVLQHEANNTDGNGDYLIVSKFFQTWVERVKSSAENAVCLGDMRPRYVQLPQHYFINAPMKVCTGDQ